MLNLLKAWWNSPYRHYPTVFVIELPDGSLWQKGLRLGRGSALATWAEVKRIHPKAKLVAVK